MQRKHFESRIHPDGRSEATSEICANPAVNLWTVAAGFSAVRAVEYPFYDGNGNITDWMDADGTLVAHHEYDPYGNETTGNPPASFGFSTKPLDPTLGLYYYGYRFYSLNLGRWINRDSIEEPGGLNLYMALQNSSVANFDPDGRAVMCLPILLNPETWVVVAEFISAVKYTATTIIITWIVVEEAIEVWQHYEETAPCKKCEEAGLKDAVKTRTREKNEKKCKPCEPYPAGMMYGITVDTGHDHGKCLKKTGSVIHWHYLVVNQNPETCECFERREFGGCGHPIF